jgi:hypothetical protein
MISLVLSDSHLAKMSDKYFGLGNFPKWGFVFSFIRDEVKYEYLSFSQSEDVQLIEKNILYANYDGDFVLGSKPEITLEKGFEEVQFLKDGVFLATQRISRRETVELLSENGLGYKVSGPINIKGYEDGIFYGSRRVSNSMIGISKGEVVWEVVFKKSEDFRGLYPFKQEHHFYLSENNQFQCYSYSGGKHVFNFPLSEIPSEVLEFDGRTVFQTSKNIISLDESGNLLGSINLPHNKNVLYEGHHLLANDDNYIYVIDRETSDVVIYDYSLSERHRVSIPKDFSVHFQRVSSELNVLNLQCAKENIIGSSYMSFWHPNETLDIQTFVSDENNYSVERIENDGKSSYEVTIDTDNKHDFFRLCDVIVMDVANKYGEDYCERVEVDRQFGGDIRVYVNSELFEIEPDWIATIQDRLNHMIKTLGGNMQGGVVSGDKQTYIDVTLIPQG